jgi:hypothetical protein
VAYQPYGARSSRRQTAALQSMQRGRGPLAFTGGGQARRAASKKRRRRKTGRARYSSPLHKILRMRQVVGRS